MRFWLKTILPTLALAWASSSEAALRLLQPRTQGGALAALGKPQRKWASTGRASS